MSFQSQQTLRINAQTLLGPNRRNSINNGPVICNLCHDSSNSLHVDAIKFE